MASADDTLTILADSLAASGQDRLLSTLLENRLADDALKLVGEFRAGTLTTERLWAYIGAVESITSLMSSLQRRIRKGIHAAENLGSLNG